MKKLKLTIAFLITFFIGLIITSPFYLFDVLFFMDDLFNSVPNQKFYVIDSVNIDGRKIWLLKNVQSDKNSWCIMSYMINKKPETEEKTISLCKKLIKNQQYVIQKKLIEYPNTEDITIKLYMESKKLPKYYIETYTDRWHQRDIITDHDEELLATIYMNLNLEITDIIVYH